MLGFQYFISFSRRWPEDSLISSVQTLDFYQTIVHFRNAISFLIEQPKIIPSLPHNIISLNKGQTLFSLASSRKDETHVRGTFFFRRSTQKIHRGSNMDTGKSKSS